MLSARIQSTNNDKANRLLLIYLYFMARLFGIIIPDTDRVAYGITRIYGIGWANGALVMKKAGIDTHKRMKDLTEDEMKKLIAEIEKGYLVEGELREEVNENIKRLKEIGSYRGIRHMRGLPVDGQRTKSNARTKKGKRKTVGALKKEVLAKMEQGKTAAPAK
jgi:small subunit ribosomal protein S13